MNSRYADLIPRLISAFLVAIVGVPILWYGGMIRTLFLFVIVVLALFEYFKVALPVPSKLIYGFTVLYALFPLGVLITGTENGFWLLFTGLYVIGIALICSIELLSNEINLQRMVQAGLGGIIYPLLPLTALLVVDQRYSGEHLLWVLACVVAADTTAYFAGRLAGGAPISPRISPNKTVSGAISGILAASLISVSWGVSFNFEQPIIRLVALGLLIGILAMIGDLFESLIKRSLGVKDLGTLLPGHGGILDRIDAVLFAFPVIFLL